MRDAVACLSMLLLCAMPGGRDVSAAEAGQDAVWRWHGRGVQIYDCVATAGRYGWKPVGPDAVLTDAAGRVRGRHSVGPAWQAPDGSRVTGTVVQSIPAPRPDAVPWLVLAARSHAGSGMLDRVAFILRPDTVGGVPAAGGCVDKGSAVRARVPYDATYVFVPAPDPAASSGR